MQSSEKMQFLPVVQVLEKKARGLASYANTPLVNLVTLTKVLIFLLQILHVPQFSQCHLINITP